MANRYANLIGSNKIKDEWQKINTGFDLVQADMDEKADADDLVNLENVVNSHIGAGGNAHAEATDQQAGFMSAQDKQKLDGVEAGAQVNQNAFAKVNDVEANDPSDELTITGGTGITVTTNPNTKEVIVTATGEATPGPHGPSHTEHGADPIPTATTTEGGLMSADHVQMLEAHASRHVAGGADPLTPEMIGAIPISAATSVATPNTIVQRDPAGRFKAGVPVAADDVARKAEIDVLSSYAEYRLSAAQSIPNNTLTPIAWDAVSPSDDFSTLESGNVKIVNTGKYLIIFSIAWTSSTVRDDTFAIRVNGVDRKAWRPNDSSTRFGSTILTLSAGDIVSAEIIQTSGSSQTILQDARYTWMQVRRIG